MSGADAAGAVVQVAVDDGPALAAWYAVIEAASEDLWPGRPGWLPEELRAAAAPSPLTERWCRRVMLAARYGAQTVGAATLDLPLADNEERAELELWVLPGRRRRGIGTALLKVGEDRARAADRRQLVMEHDEPERLAGRSPARRFASRAGFSLALTEARRDLSLPAEPGRLDRLRRQAQESSAGYRIEVYRDRYPDEAVSDRALLGRRMSTDAPSGDIEQHEERWESDRVRATEDLVRRQDRSLLASVARHEASGRLVAFSELQWSRRRPDVAYQWDTLVLEQHRGHGLGLAVKLANLDALAVASPGTRLVTTTNAETNRFMVAINDALGFGRVGGCLSWSRPVGGVR